MKKIITILMTIVMLIFCISPAMAEETQYIYNSESVTVYVTVNDITDVDEPLKTLIDRIPISVSNFDVSEFGEQFTGISILDSGVTYLHVLIELHERLYGTGAVSENFKIDSDGVTRIFMGQSVGSIMYKNGKYIFAIPQYVNVHDGDEVNICLYDEGYSQAIASFSEAYINAEAGATLNLNLFMHHWYPEMTEAIEGAQIIDENGAYIADESGSIIETDENGNFSVTFPKTGLYRMSIMPTVGYYMSDNGGTTVTWWEEITITETVEKERIVKENTYVNSADLPEASAIRQAAEALDNVGVSIGFITAVDDWISEAEADEIRYTNTSADGRYIKSNIFTETYTEEVTRTELVKHEEYISGEAKQKVDYTTPWCVVNVTNDMTVISSSQNDTDITFSVINSGKYSGKAICAAYNGETGTIPQEIKSSAFAETMRFTFDETHDSYRLFLWDGRMKPVGESYTYIPGSQTLDWSFDRTAPTNVIVTGQ